MTLIMERDFSDAEITECKMLRNTIVSSHEFCDGVGMVLHESEEGVEDCDCEAVYKYVKSLVYARLPKRYWTVAYNSKKYLLDTDADLKLFDKMLKENLIGCSSVIFGEPGTGKTALLSLIGKIAIWLKKLVFYLTAEDLLDYVRKDIEHKVFVDRMAGADIILLDDVTKFNKSEWAIGQIEYNLRKFYDNGANLIVTSTLPIEAIEETYSKGLASIMRRLDKVLMVEWTGKGSVNHVDYMADPILAEARAYFKSTFIL